MSSEFERLGGETAWEGKIANIRIERFRHADGTEVTREVIVHQGAVGVVAHDDEHVWLVRQPREAVGSPDLLEVPAGKLDVEGEEPLATAERELAEEIGKSASSWRELKRFYTSPGFTDERVVMYEATELSDAPEAGGEEDERIDVVPWPLDRLDDAIDACEDSKSLIGLLWLARELEAQP
jgi:ADP-ribose pyrophosphatase